MQHIVHELLAGVTTFFSMVYILVLIPQILSLGGIPFGAALSIVVATIIFTTLLASCIGGYPVAAGPGLSVLTYLAYSLVGTNSATWPQALGLVFWGGIAIFIISITQLRQLILIQIPDTLKRAAIAGLGLFFIVIGLKQLGIIQIESYGFSLSSLGTIEQGIGLFGLLLLIVLQSKKVKLTFLIPILCSWILALLLGVAHWRGTFSTPIAPYLSAIELSSILEPKFWGPLISIILITLFDTGATITALAHLLGWIEPNGSIRRANRIFLADGLGSILAATLGTTSCAFYAESSSGICAGGKTYLVGCVVASCCLASLFFEPLLSSIPLCATAPVLLGIGGILAMQFRTIEWKDPLQWIPFLTAALAIPLLFSIYWGLAFGFIIYTALHICRGKTKELHAVVWILTLLFLTHLGITSTLYKLQ